MTKVLFSKRDTRNKNSPISNQGLYTKKVNKMNTIKIILKQGIFILLMVGCSNGIIKKEHARGILVKRYLKDDLLGPRTNDSTIIKIDYERLDYFIPVNSGMKIEDAVRRIIEEKQLIVDNTIFILPNNRLNYLISNFFPDKKEACEEKYNIPKSLFNLENSPMLASGVA